MTIAVRSTERQLEGVWRLLSPLRGQGLLLLPLFCLYGLLGVLPVAIIAKMSFSEGASSFTKLFASSIFSRTVQNTLWISLETTVYSVFLAYLLASWMWRSNGVRRVAIVGFVLLPFWTAVLIKNFAWSALLQDNGPINQALIAMGWISEPITLLHNRFAVILGMVHYCIPYAVFPIFSTMLSIDDRLARAAKSLGAPASSVFFLIILPLTRQGVYAASLLVFIISTGFYITPVVLGSPQDMMIANLVDFYAHQLVDFGTAAALAVVILAAAGILVAIYQSLPKEGQHGAA